MSDAEISIDFDEVIGESEKAFKVKIGDQEHWMPKSQVRLYRKNNKCFGPEWLFLKKGLI